MEFHPNDLSDLDDLTEEHLGFSALSDGLGFSKRKRVETHSDSPLDATPVRQESPFSPPVRPRTPSTGLGAVAAGPARPAPGIFGPSSAPSATIAKSGGSTAASAAQVLAEPAAPRRIRVAAFTLDAALIFFPLALGWKLSFGADAAEIFLTDPAAPLGLFAVVLAVYFLLSESLGGQSLAKMMLGLRVVEDDKYEKPTGFRQTAARLGLFLAGLALLGLGFFASFWDSKRRPWHDRYSGSIVRRKA